MRTFSINGVTIEQHPSGSSFLLWRNHEQTLSQLPLRQTVVNRQSQHGAVSSSQFYGARVLPFSIEIIGSPSDVAIKREAVKTALTLGQQTATLDSGKTIDVFVSQTPQFTTTNDPRILLCEFTLRADDPFFYSTTIQTASGAEKAITSTYTIQDGSLPTLPSTIQETSFASFSVSPATETPPVFTVTGPCNGPVIRNLTIGEELDFDGMTLSEGENLIIDVRKRTATVDGVSRTGFLTASSTWFNLRAGSNSISLYDGEKPLAGQLSLSYRERFL